MQKNVEKLQIWKHWLFDVFYVFPWEKYLFMLMLENQQKSNNLDNDEDENESKTSTSVSFHTEKKRLAKY